MENVPWPMYVIVMITLAGCQTKWFLEGESFDDVIDWEIPCFEIFLLGVGVFEGRYLWIYSRYEKTVCRFWKLDKIRFQPWYTCADWPVLNDRKLINTTIKWWRCPPPVSMVTECLTVLPINKNCQNESEPYLCEYWDYLQTVWYSWKLAKYPFQWM